MAAKKKSPKKSPKKTLKKSAPRHITITVEGDGELLVVARSKGKALLRMPVIKGRSETMTLPPEPTGQG